jgi:ribonuclease HII
VAAAVILDPKNPITGLKDSKSLSSKKREFLAEIIKNTCLAWSLGQATVEEIDEINILQASLLAMKRAIEALHVRPSHVQVDGNFTPKVDCSVEGIINGDKLIPAISAASIVAKVARDGDMVKYHALYPEYGFARHKGYGTKQHLLALEQFGITPIHRRSFAPVRTCSKSLLSWP